MEAILAVHKTSIKIFFGRFLNMKISLHFFRSDFQTIRPSAWLGLRSEVKSHFTEIQIIS